MDKKSDHPLLDALFGVDSEEESLVDLLFASPAQGSKKRPWASAKEECPNCGSAFPAGGVCPGCGLHDEEMPWGDSI